MMDMVAVSKWSFQSLPEDLSQGRIGLGCQLPHKPQYKQPLTSVRVNELRSHQIHSQYLVRYAPVINIKKFKYVMQLIVQLNLIKKEKESNPKKPRKPYGFFA